MAGGPVGDEADGEFFGLAGTPELELEVGAAAVPKIQGILFIHIFIRIVLICINNHFANK